MSSFAHHYARLNPAQKQAVDTIEGPVMVIAGPGTGKTQILTLRIANILKKTDTPPSGILALTYTEAGVYAMRKRLVELIGPTGYSVGIFTFHGFCNELISRYPDSYPRIIGSQPLSEVEAYTYVEECIDTSEVTHLRPFGAPHYYARSIVSAIHELKREGVSPAEARVRVTREREAFEQTDDRYHTSGPHKGKLKSVYSKLLKQIEKNADLCVLYEKYEALLRERKRYDYEDMIVETVYALSHDPDLLLELQETYLYVLADEHQDANNSQNKLIELLASFHASPNIFLVGDAKQAIYRFQGASLENFLYFKNRYPDATLVHLTDNYRSRQHILDSSHSLISQDAMSTYETVIPLRAQQIEQGETITIAELPEPALEYAFVASSVRALIDQGVPPHEIAILYRTNASASSLTPALLREGIPYVVESSQDVLTHNAVRGLYALLSCVANYGNEELLTRVLYLDYLELPPLDLYRLARMRARTRRSLYECIEDLSGMQEAGITCAHTLQQYAARLSKWVTFSRNRPLLEALDHIMHESGYMAYQLARADGRERIENIRALVRYMQNLVAGNRGISLADALAHLQLMETYGCAIPDIAPRYTSDRVRLMTAHKSKGLEFDYVFISGATDTAWGERRTIEHFTILAPTRDEASIISDERRLFYVALTRARHGVTVTYPARSLSGKHLLPSRFIEEINPAHRTLLDTSAYVERVTPAKILAPYTEHRASVAERAYLQSLFLEQGLSPTGYNKYLKDPWAYFFETLLHLPKTPNTHMCYGSAIHAALRDYLERLREGENVDIPYALSRFEYHIARTPLSRTEYDQARKKGLHTLSTYLTAREGKIPPPLAVEYTLHGMLPLSAGISFPLRGILDAVFPTPDGRVVVCDFKTGASKSRNRMEGKTRATDAGDFKRQLVFYALLIKQAREDKRISWMLSHADIDFVEPDGKNKIREPTSFVISDDEVDALARDVARVAEEIYQLSFFAVPPDASSSFVELAERVSGGVSA